MHTLRLAVEVAWAVFWIGWLVTAFTAKRSVSRGPGIFGMRGLTGSSEAVR